MDLDNLVFKTDTRQLEDALQKVNELSAATSKFSVDSVKASRDIAKAKEQQVRAEEKLAVTEAKYVDTLEKLKQKQIDFNNALGKTPSAVKPVDDGISGLEKLIGRLSNQYTDMASGFTKGESSILNQARNMGVFGAELQPIISLLEKIKTLNKDPFDASLGGVRSITQEFEKLQQRANLAAQGIMLTTKQLGEYSKLAAEAAGKVEGMGFDPKQGEGLAKYNQLLADSQNKYLETVASVNKLTQAEKDRNDALKQQEKLLASNKAISDAMIRETAGQVGQKSPELKQMAEFYKKQAAEADKLTKAQNLLAASEQRLVFVNEQLAAGLTTASANALFKYKQQLEQVGTSSDLVAKKMQAFKEQLVVRQGYSPIKKLADDTADVNKRLDHLSRALGPQITDIFVGLATGQNLLTVALQQGGQIRDQVALAGVESSKMGKALTDSFRLMVGSLKDVSVALGSLFVGAIMSVGTSIGEFVAKITLADKSLAALSEKFPALAKVATFALGAVGTLAIAAVGTFIVTSIQATIEQEKLTRALVLSGATMGIGTKQALEYSKSMETLGITQTDTIKVITEMAKVGGFTKEQIDLVTEAAVGLNKYGGVAIEDTVKKFAEVGKDPVKALIEYGKQTGLVTVEQIKHIRALDETGKKTQAVNEAMAIMGGASKESIQRLKDESGSLMRFWIGIVEQVKKFKDFLMSIGRTAVDDKSYEEQTRKVQQLGQMLESSKSKEVERLFKIEAETLSKMTRLRQASAESTVENTQQTALAVAEYGRNLKDLEKSENKAEAAAKKAEEQRKRDINVYEDIMNKAEGLNKTYNDSVDALDRLRLAGEKGGITQWEYNAAFQALYESQPAYIARQKEVQKGVEDINKSTKDFSDKMVESQANTTKQAEELKYLTDMLGMTEDQQKLYTIEYQKNLKLKELDVQLEKELKAIRDDKSIADNPYIQYGREQQVIKDNAAKRLVIEQEANYKIAEDYQKKFEAIQKELGDIMFLALTNRGASAGKKLRDLIKAELMKPITVLVNAVVGDIMNAFTGKSGAAAVGESAIGSMASSALTGTVIAGSSLAAIGSSIATGFTATLGGSSVAAASSAYSAAGMGGVAAGLEVGAALATYGPYVLAAYLALDSLGVLDNWSGDPDAFLVQQGLGTKQAYKTSTASRLGTIGFVSGNASIMKNGQMINEYGQTQDISVKAQNSALEVIRNLDNAIASTLSESQIKEIATNMSGWYQKSWSVESDTIEKFIASRYETILGMLDSSFTKLKDYQKEGEKLADTAVRLVTNFSTMQNVFKDLGISTEVVTVTFATSLADMLGGIANFSSSMQYFYDNFFSEPEQIANQTRKLTEAFDALGITIPNTKQEFRSLLQGALSSGDKGLAASLLGLMQPFNEFISKTEDAAAAMQDLTNSLLEEINRLRGAILGDAGVSGNVSGLTSEFAILTAQARTGSTTAIEKLPEYSQAIEQAVAASAVNASDVAYARAWLAESLGTTSNVLTGIEPSTGSTFTQDVATPSTVNGATALTASTSSQADLIAALVAEVQGLRAEVRADVAANNKTAKILERANQDGETISVSLVA